MNLLYYHDAWFSGAIKVRYCIYWENMPFIPSSVPKLPLSMEPSRGKMMKSDNPAPDSLGLGLVANLYELLIVVPRSSCIHMADKIISQQVCLPGHAGFYIAHVHGHFLDFCTDAKVACSYEFILKKCSKIRFSDCIGFFVTSCITCKCISLNHVYNNSVIT